METTADFFSKLGFDTCILMHPRDVVFRKIVERCVKIVVFSDSLRKNIYNDYRL